ncbi:hypothetical protein B0H15DRAFT_86439 [Mycena belliarum]|uniref:Uncharacterized protein n=1 Tax=Mycena belliarum TaxID=1033014 RepID=A0AAD6XIC9_9AGAR|nr:hypothetical protein B0H15DRAFT_86439 [Mycena belliae]
MNCAHQLWPPSSRENLRKEREKDTACEVGTAQRKKNNGERQGQGSKNELAQHGSTGKWRKRQAGYSRGLPPQPYYVRSGEIRLAKLLSRPSASLPQLAEPHLILVSCLAAVGRSFGEVCGPVSDLRHSKQCGRFFGLTCFHNSLWYGHGRLPPARPSLQSAYQSPKPTALAIPALGADSARCQRRSYPPARERAPRRASLERGNRASAERMCRSFQCQRRARAGARTVHFIRRRRRGLERACTAAAGVCLVHVRGPFRSTRRRGGTRVACLGSHRARTAIGAGVRRPGLARRDLRSSRLRSICGRSHPTRCRGATRFEHPNRNRARRREGAVPGWTWTGNLRARSELSA